MTNYRTYPTVKSTPKRKTRKALRKTIFWENKFLGNKLRKEQKEGKKND